VKAEKAGAFSSAITFAAFFGNVFLSSHAFDDCAQAFDKLCG
jgi:hypothetical protein